MIKRVIRTAANFCPVAPGPHPRRELTMRLALGFACPRARMAAGACHCCGSRTIVDKVIGCDWRTRAPVALTNSAPISRIVAR